MNYQQYIMTPAWKAKAAETKKRDGNRCKWCGSPDNLEVHHLSYAHLGNERPNEIITLCHGCHTCATVYNRLQRTP